MSTAPSSLKTPPDSPAPFLLLNKRVKSAIIASLIAGAITLFALWIHSENVDSSHMYYLYHEFTEWGRGDHISVKPAGQEFILSIEQMGDAAQGVGDSVGGLPDVAGIARLSAIFSVMIAVFITYRSQLEDYYRKHDQQAQLSDFDDQNYAQRCITRLCYMVATIFGCYVIFSLMWVVLSLMFTDAQLSYAGMGAVVILFTSATTFGATYWAITLTTRALLQLGLFTFWAGLLLSFALAPVNPHGNWIPGTLPEIHTIVKLGIFPIQPSYWWEHSVSNVGTTLPSAPVFSAALISTVLVLWAMWFDIDSIVKSLVEKAHKSTDAKVWINIDKVIKSLIKRAQDPNELDKIKIHLLSACLFIFYSAGLVGIILVGTIRSHKDFPANEILHSGGAYLPIASVFLFNALFIIFGEGLNVARGYKYFSVFIIGIGVIAVAFYRTKAINFAIFEIIGFILFTSWLYIGVDYVLTYADKTYSKPNDALPEGAQEQEHQP